MLTKLFAVTIELPKTFPRLKFFLNFIVIDDMGRRIITSKHQLSVLLEIDSMLIQRTIFFIFVFIVDDCNIFTALTAWSQFQACTDGLACPTYLIATIATRIVIKSTADIYHWWRWSHRYGPLDEAAAFQGLILGIWSKRCGTRRRLWLRSILFHF
jgi:hypothetical protein